MSLRSRGQPEEKKPAKSQSLEHILISDYDTNNTNTWHIKNNFGSIIELIAISIITL